jgi:His-Xaa-Ser system radical SAM maturase HxsC
MIKLHARMSQSWSADPFVVRVTTDASHAGGPAEGQTDGVRASSAECEALLVPDGQYAYVPGFRVNLSRTSVPLPGDTAVILLPEPLHYLGDGDVLRVIPRTGEIAVLYRRSSAFNSVLVTERCNSNCLMCSQPPKDADDGHLADAYLRAIPLMAADTPELGITGGEPTLLGDRLIELLQACRDHLPRTTLHMLSNGRLFNYLSLAQKVAGVGHPDLMVGVPVYSDVASRHDFVVQASGAFDQTIRGLMNLARCGVKTELRVVLHRQTVDRLPQLGRFITRNLPFIDHVALMGLEMMGYVRMNLDALWVDPADYQGELKRAVEELVVGRMNVSIYNHQLCVLDRSLWPYARKSISDWKNVYVPACDACEEKDRCGGFFASAKLRFSDHIRPFARPQGAGTVDVSQSFQRKAGTSCG